MPEKQAFGLLSSLKYIKVFFAIYENTEYFWHYYVILVILN